MDDSLKQKGARRPRFSGSDANTVRDLHTGLMWSRDAALTEFPATWAEALEFVRSLNRQEFAGYRDWHLPNRRELFSLISHDRVNPALPEGHPFANVFAGYYWTSTTCARLPDQAWYIHLGGAKVYRGMKYASYMVWPVRCGRTDVGIPETRQRGCFDDHGRLIACTGTGQDAEMGVGRPWPEPRFAAAGDCVEDRMTGRMWAQYACAGHGPLSWYQAKETIAAMNRDGAMGCNDWRIPGIRELESIVDMGVHSPALVPDHPFEGVQTHYWSADTSMYERRYAWALYLQDGAVGVGYKQDDGFFLWPVCGCNQWE